MELKKCSICKQKLPLVAFHKNSQQKDKLECRCKFCRRKTAGSKKTKGKTKNNDYKKMVYWLRKMFNPDYEKEHYKKYSEHYKRKRDERERGLRFVKKYENPFKESEKIEWHHINNIEVVAIPKDLHDLYKINNRETHRENLTPVVKQIYEVI